MAEVWVLAGKTGDGDFKGDQDQDRVRDLIENFACFLDASLAIEPDTEGDSEEEARFRTIEIRFFVLLIGSIIL